MISAAVIVLSVQFILAADNTPPGITNMPPGAFVECEDFKLGGKWKTQSSKQYPGFSGKGHIVDSSFPGINRFMPSKSLTVPRPGRYNVWVRAYLGGPPNKGIYDREFVLDINGKPCAPTHRAFDDNGFAWEYAGSVAIGQDRQAKIIIKDIGRSPAIVDCILLTEDMQFKPAGWTANSRRPGPTAPFLASNVPPTDATPFHLTKAAKQHVENLHDSTGQYQINLSGTLDEFNTADYPGTYGHCHRLTCKFQPNQYLSIENIGDEDIVNPRLVINGRRNWHSADTILAGILRPGMTDAEKAMAIWGFASSIEVQCHENNRRVGPYYPEEQSHPSRNTYKERANPVKAANTYYCSGCQLSATNCVVLLRRAGLGSRAVWMCPLNQYEIHCVAEAWYDGAWHLFDPERRAFYLDSDNTTVASYETLHKKPALAARTHDGGFAAKYMAKRSHAEEYKNFYPPAVMPVDPDWVSHMSMTLRPCERYVWLWSNSGKFRHGVNPRNRNYPPYRLANGKIIYRPGLQDPLFRKSLLSERNIKTTAQDGRRPAVHCDRPGAVSFISYKVKTPYPIVGGIVGGKFFRKTKTDTCAIYISANDSDWKKIWSADKTGTIERYLSVDGVLPFKSGPAIYECYVKYEFTAAADPTDVGIDAVNLEFDTQMSAAGLPSLSVGENKVVYRNDSKQNQRLRISHGWRESSATKPPLPPTEALSPENKAQTENVKTIAWTPARDPDGEEIVNYHVQVSPREDMMHAVSPNFDRLTFSGKPQWNVPQGWFVSGKTYYWRIRAKDKWGAWSGWSPIWKFTVKP